MMIVNHRSRRATGKIGETLAASFLQLKGYQILERNWRSGRVEIDLIARKGAVIHFVEVKTRRSLRYGWPEEYINSKKIARMTRAVEHYLQTQTDLSPVQLDILSILLSDGEPAVFWLIEDVFP
jgi:putative endonuclease